MIASDPSVTAFLWVSAWVFSSLILILIPGGGKRLLSQDMEAGISQEGSGETEADLEVVAGENVSSQFTQTRSRMLIH